MPVTATFLYGVPVSALLFLLAIMGRFISNRQLPILQNRIFSLALWVGMSDIVFHILSALIVSHLDLFAMPFAYTVISIFYMLELFFPSMMVLYVFSLSRSLKKSNIGNIALAMMPTAICALTIILNPIMQGFFYFSGNTFYLGRAFAFLHLVTIFDVVICVLYVVLKREQVPSGSVATVLSLSLLACAAVATRMQFIGWMASSVCIALGLLFMYFIIQKPEEKVDNLTGLLNLDAMISYIDELVSRDAHYHVLVVKVENVRRINAIFGYTVGSLTLQCVADFLSTFSPDLKERSRLRKNADKYSCSETETQLGDARKLEKTLPSAWAFRLMSNQFAIVSTNEETSENVAKSIHQRFQQPWTIRGLELQLMETMLDLGKTSSFSSGEELYKVVELMLPTVPKGDTVTMSESVLNRVERQISIERELTSAIKEGKLEVNLQPIFSVEEGKFTVAEALVRFTHSEFGMVEPSEFIPIAEKYGLIAAIDEFVLRSVCAFLRDSDAEKALQLKSVSMNVSVTELAASAFSKKVCEIVDEYQIPHEKIVFDITESATTTSYLLMAENMQILADKGFRFALDNFGSGFANVVNLTSLPFSVVKIDRCMLTAAEESSREKIIFENAIDVFRKMQMITVVQGAEKKSHTDLCIRSSADYVQGFYYARPMNFEDYSAFVRLHNRQAKKRDPSLNDIIVVSD
ncbi:MAG: EAL domain-containing protein [Clostridiales bacterium]|nr:EAL domain-containing protein [Clostridiales bacterium]